MEAVSYKCIVLCFSISYTVMVSDMTGPILVFAILVEILMTLLGHPRLGFHVFHFGVKNKWTTFFVNVNTHYSFK